MATGARSMLSRILLHENCSMCWENLFLFLDCDYSHLFVYFRAVILVLFVFELIVLKIPCLAEFRQKYSKQTGKGT